MKELGHTAVVMWPREDGVKPDLGFHVGARSPMGNTALGKEKMNEIWR